MRHQREIQQLGSYAIEVSIKEPVEEIKIRQGNLICPPSHADEPSNKTSCRFHFSLLGLVVGGTATIEAKTRTGINIFRNFQVSRPKLKEIYDGPAPLILNSIGRSGSSLMMNFLSCHPEICVEGDHPFENAFAKKSFLNLANAFPTKSEQSSAEGNHELAYTSAPNSFSTDLLNCITKVVKHYHEVSSQQADNHSSLTYWCEKNLSPSSLLWEACSGTREIILVRDPRDIICSTLNFNKKRGTTKFGRQFVKSDEEFISFRAKMANSWVVEPYKLNKSKVCLIKYEDLIGATRSELEKVWNYLGLEGGATNRTLENDLETALQDRNSHMTSPDKFSSIGRWKKQLQPNLVKLCERHFSDFMATFGYN